MCKYFCFYPPFNGLAQSICCSTFPINLKLVFIRYPVWLWSLCSVSWPHGIRFNLPTPSAQCNMFISLLIFEGANKQTYERANSPWGNVEMWKWGNVCPTCSWKLLGDGWPRLMSNGTRSNILWLKCDSVINRTHMWQGGGLSVCSTNK